MSPILNFPEVPYQSLPDFRAKRILKYERIIEVVATAIRFRDDLCERDEPICPEKLLRALASKYSAQWSPDNRYFVAQDGTPWDNSILAYVDFSAGCDLHLREEGFTAMVSGLPLERSLIHEFKSAIGHEAGHIVDPSHRRRISARGRSQPNAGRTAALDRRRLEDQSFRPTSYYEDLEQEADLFGDVLMAPPQALYHQPSICEIETKYDVSKYSAERSALLAKDYFRAIRLSKKAGKNNGK